jgi:hypothetical protein
MYELSLHQDIQERVREEIDVVLKKHDGKITYEAIQEMEYLDKVVAGKAFLPLAKNYRNIFLSSLLVFNVFKVALLNVSFLSYMNMLEPVLFQIQVAS